MNQTRSFSPSALICTAALFFMAVNCVLAIQKTSITSDEVIHIAAGYYSLSTAEYRMNAEHPPLAKMWSALPLLLFLPHDSGPAAPYGNFSQRGAQFYSHFWKVNQDAFLRIWFWTRTAMVAFTLALGLLLFLAARRWFGTTAAVFAVLMYSLEPTVLGHGRLVHTDIAAAFMYLLFFFVLDGYHRYPSILRALTLGFVTALALLTKFSMIVLLPVLVAVLLSQMWRNRSRVIHLILAGAIVILTIQCGYAFRNPPLGADATWIEENARYPMLVNQTIEALSYVFPRDFLFGMYVVETHNSGGHSSSILGQYGYKGWWYYFPVAFVLKTPIPFVLICLAAILWSLWLTLTVKRSFGLVLVALMIYSALAMSSGINIGIRHFLPAFPFLFMLSGALLAAIHERARRAGLAVAICIIGFMGFEALATFPYYLSYMNQLKGTQPGWRYLSDSNVEWGDAVPELVTFLRAKGVNRVSGALLGGNMTLQFYGIEFVELYGAPPQTPYVALGASFLNGSTVEYGNSASRRGTEQERVNFFASYRTRKPIAIFGNSIYLFENP